MRAFVYLKAICFSACFSAVVVTAANALLSFGLLVSVSLFLFRYRKSQARSLVSQLMRGHFMKSRLLGIAVVAALTLSVGLFGCGQQDKTSDANQNDAQQESTENGQNESAESSRQESAANDESGSDEKTSTTYAVGKSVKTPLVKFTLDRAELAIALNDTMTVGAGAPSDGYAGGSFFLPKKYSASKDSDNPFVAGKGHTLVSLTFTIKNLDRTSVNLFEYEATRAIPVVYDGQTYTGQIEFGAEKIKGDKWKDYTSSNILLSAGETASYKAYVDIPVEIKDLSSPFDVSFNLPASTSENRIENTKFTYAVD